MVEKKSNRLAMNVVIYTILIAFSILCIGPIISVVSISLTSERDIVEYGYQMFPKNISTTAYQFIFKNPMQILRAYGVSITVTVVGTMLSLFLVSMLAYVISRRDFAFHRGLAFFVFFTMLFNGGLVPNYMLISQGLHLKDTIWALIVPYLTSAWNILLLKTYFQKIPTALLESARIDGCSEFRTFFRIVMPLSKPALATVGLLITLNFWNDWWLSMLYIENDKLINLQYLLVRMMRDLTELLQNVTTAPAGATLRDFPNESARMAMCVLAAGPMLFVFPFFQKYFVKGLTVGAVKE